MTVCFFCFLITDFVWQTLSKPTSKQLISFSLHTRLSMSVHLNDCGCGWAANCALFLHIMLSFLYLWVGLVFQISANRNIYLSLLLFIDVEFHDETTTLLNVNSPLTGDGKYMLLSDDVFNVSVRMFPRRFLGGLTKSFRWRTLNTCWIEKKKKLSAFYHWASY